MHEYDATSIKPIRWGELVQLPNGHWRTSWALELDSLDATHLHDVAAAAGDSEAGFMPSLTIQGQAEVLVTIETSRWGMELDYDDLTYRLVKLIYSPLSPIRVIQGITPGLWRPLCSTLGNKAV